jgi:hypothetical protein
MSGNNWTNLVERHLKQADEAKKPVATAKVVANKNPKITIN